MDYEQLKLENQLCFPVYAASRLITREYQPLLAELGITYPQYLVLMVLWETNGLPVNDIAHKLLLNTNTITPLLKRLEQQGLVLRTRSATDERKVIITLTQQGAQLRHKAAEIPQKLATQILQGPLSGEELLQLKQHLLNIVDYLQQHNKGALPE